MSRRAFQRKLLARQESGISESLLYFLPVLFLGLLFRLQLVGSIYGNLAHMEMSQVVVSQDGQVTTSTLSIDRTDMLARAARHLRQSEAWGVYSERIPFQLGQIAFLQGDEASTVAAFADYAHLSGSCDWPPQWLILRAIQLARREDYSAAQAALQRAVQLLNEALPGCRLQARDRMARLLVVQGRGYFWKQPALAETMFHLAIRINPNSPLAYIILADFQRDIYEQWSAAAENYRRAIALSNPTDESVVPAYIGLGRVDVKLERWAEAEWAASTALEIGASPHWPHFLLGQVAAGRGEKHDVIRHLEIVVTTPTEDPEQASPIWWANRYLGAIYEERGDYDRAVVYYHQALGASTDPFWQAKALLFAGQAQYRGGHLTEAISEFEHGWALLPGPKDKWLYTELGNALGDAYFESGQPLLAVELYKQVLIISPDNARAAAGLARIER